jgi:hypothetical protein
VPQGTCGVPRHEHDIEPEISKDSQRQVQVGTAVASLETAQHANTDAQSRGRIHLSSEQPRARDPHNIA